MAPGKRPLTDIHEEQVAVLKHLMKRLRTKCETFYLPFLPGKERVHIQPIFEPEKVDAGFGERKQERSRRVSHGVETTV